MAKRTKPTGPISYKRGKGLMVSMHASAPQSADEKVIVAKSIIQAAMAAHDSGVLDDKNYDIHWPLSMAINLLEEVSEQMGGGHG